MEITHESSNQTLRSAQPAKPYAFSRKVFCEGMRDGVPIALGGMVYLTVRSIPEWRRRVM